MDPNACADRILDAFEAEDWEEVEAAATDLLIWLGKGGFEPDGTRVDRLRKLAASEAHVGAFPDSFEDALQALAEVGQANAGDAAEEPQS
jgi:hypothetical protein